MNTTLAVALLFLAACLEAGGDALIRAGLTARLPLRIAYLLVGAIVLFCYGLLVNTPRWDFGRLLGAYVACFFVVAQAIAWFAFGQKPGTSVIAGGSLIVAGGIVISFWRT